MNRYEITRPVAKMIDLSAGDDAPLYREPASKQLCDLAAHIEQSMADLCLAARNLSTLSEMKGSLESRLYNQTALLPKFSPAHPAVLETQLPQDQVHRVARHLHASIDWFIHSSYDRSQRDGLRDYLQFAIENLENRILKGSLPLKPRAFEKFKKLPPELRRMIWKLVVPAKGQTAGMALNHRFSRNKPKQRVWIEQPLHPMFHVNSEARRITLETYTLQLVSGLDLCNTRIDPQKDSLLLSYHHGTALPPKTLQTTMQLTSSPLFQIQHLFLHDSIWSEVQEVQVLFDVGESVG